MSYVGVNFCELPSNQFLAQASIVTTPALLNPVPRKSSNFTYDLTQPFSLKQYDEQFITESIPSATQYVYNDDYFAFLRVGGFHPILIEKVKSLPTNFPMTNVILNSVTGFETDDLGTMILDGRLFIVDYKALSSLQPGSLSRRKFVYAPIGLFGMQKGGK